MSAISQQAAAESSLFRHWDQALAIVADAKVSKVVGIAPLRAIEGSRPALAPAGNSHPALLAPGGRLDRRTGPDPGSAA
jgi:hypothetical protein